MTVMAQSSGGVGQTVLALGDHASRAAAVIRQRFPAVQLIEATSVQAAHTALESGAIDIALWLPYSKGVFPAQKLIGSASLRWLQCASAGVNHLPVWDARKLTVTNASGVHDAALAQYALCAVLMFNLGFGRFFQQQQARSWTPHILRTTQGQKVLIVGFGSVGQAVGRALRQLDISVTGVRTQSSTCPIWGEIAGVEALQELVAHFDHVVLTLPLTAATEGMFNATVIESMRPGAHLVNIGRGGIVDEDALADALRSGHLGGATLDVFADEPLPPDNPFWAMPNVTLTPHTGDIEGWEEKVVELFCGNLSRWLDGGSLNNIVDPASGY